MNLFEVEMREVAGRSMMVCDGQPVLCQLQMKPPQDGEAFDSEVLAMLVVPIEDPRAALESALATIDLDDAPNDEARELAREMIDEVREQAADMDGAAFVPLPYHDCGSPVFSLNMN